MLNHNHHYLAQQQYQHALDTGYLNIPNLYQSERFWQESQHPKKMTINMHRGIVHPRHYYGEYHGHLVKHLEIIYPVLRSQSSRLIWTAGDSSLDNKFWVLRNDAVPAVGAYKDVLQPPRMMQDVTYWLNHHLLARESSKGKTLRGAARSETAAINAAVEATTLNERSWQLRPQDIFLRENIQPEDVLVVSIVGNDIAMAPMPCTIASMGAIVAMPKAVLKNGFSFGVLPCDDKCCGCTTSTMSCACSCPPCLGYFRHLFQVRVEHYLKALTAKTKPSKILICMIYYPDERDTPAWASKALRYLGYNKDPEKIQLLIRKAFYEATSHIRVPGTQVIPVPLYQALDGKNTRHYVDRVEPSAEGGRIMAEYLLDVIENPAVVMADLPGGPVPTTALIDERG